MIRVASLNMKNFNSTNKDIAFVAKVLRECRSDIIVLQEVLDQGVAEVSFNSSGLGLLRRTIGTHWDATRVSIKERIEDDYPYLKSDKRGEGYAFLWNTQRIELLQDKNDQDILPSLFADYKPGDKLNWLRRDPGYGRFKIKNTKVEIRVINVHLISEVPSNENFISKIPIKDKAELRISEFDVVAGKIYKRIHHKRDLNFNSVYTIIIGDYNLNLEGYGEDLPSIQEVRCYDIFGNHCDWGFTKMKTVQTDRTTIKGDYSGFKNNFDHCSFIEDLKHSHAIRKCNRHIKLDESDPEEKIKEYYEKVSDHMPIVVEINYERNDIWKT